MAKEKVQFVCNSCGYDSGVWFGKCPNCGEWNTAKEIRSQKTSDRGKGGGVRRGIGDADNKPVKLGEVKNERVGRMPTGIGEVDRVLGGGFVFDSVVLLAGEPGVGKSTILLEIIKKIANTNILYASGEESAGQIKIRADRLGVKGDNLLLLSETNIETVITESDEAGLLIIDSIQTMWSADIEGSAGSVSQVKGCTQKIIEYAKKSHKTIILVGHINKEGEIAGPLTLIHMVDVVLFMEGERYQDLRLLRGTKNRFGATDEVGVFRMTDRGMEEVVNPSELLTEEESSGSEGKVTTVTMEGTRPILVEIQALVTKSFLAMPRRVGMGVDNNRLNLLTAVIQKHLKLSLYDQDIFVKVAGGLKVNEPAADLGICLAIISSFKNAPVPPKTAVFGEVGLLGEIRRVTNEERRVKEAQKLGFSKVVSGSNAKRVVEVMKVVSSQE